MNEKMIVTIGWIKPSALREFRYASHVSEWQLHDKVCAAVWLNEGTRDDVARADLYVRRTIDSPLVQVYTFPPETKDPLTETRQKTKALFKQRIEAEGLDIVWPN